MSAVYTNPLDSRKELKAGSARVYIYDSVALLAEAAAKQAAEVITRSIETNGTARVIAATGNSQMAFIDKLVQEPGVDWSRVILFHMDEYVGLGTDHPAGFRRWIRTRIAERIPVKEAHYLAGDAADLDAEMARYSLLLQEAPIDLAFVGIGENGHIAFNDPHVADFMDPKTVKCVQLDDACKRQQFGEGHFDSVEAVPNEALTITCPGLFRAKAWISLVPDRRKAKAVREAFEGLLSVDCPASIMRTHPDATVYLDRASASLLDVDRMLEA